MYLGKPNKFFRALFLSPIALLSACQGNEKISIATNTKDALVPDWDLCLSKEVSNSKSYGSDIIFMDDNSIVVSAYIHKKVKGNLNARNTSIISNISPTGHVNWTTNLGDNAYIEKLFLTEDQHIVAFGHRQISGSRGIATIHKLSRNGDILLQKILRETDVMLKISEANKQGKSLRDLDFLDGATRLTDIWKVLDKQENVFLTNITSAIALEKNHFLVTGNQRSFSPRKPKLVYISESDQNGDEVWSKVLNDTNQPSDPIILKNDRDAYFLIFSERGEKVTDKGYKRTIKNSIVTVFKLDKSGEVQKTFRHQAENRIRELRALHTESGNLFLNFSVRKQGDTLTDRTNETIILTDDLSLKSHSSYKQRLTIYDLQESNTGAIYATGTVNTKPEFKSVDGGAKRVAAKYHLWFGELSNEGKVLSKKTMIVSEDLNLPYAFHLDAAEKKVSITGVRLYLNAIDSNLKLSVNGVKIIGNKETEEEPETCISVLQATL